jgi:hypothetical protein
LRDIGNTEDRDRVRERDRSAVHGSMLSHKYDGVMNVNGEIPTSGLAR